VIEFRLPQAEWDRFIEMLERPAQDKPMLGHLFQMKKTYEPDPKPVKKPKKPKK
jgi:uncharacterized protein (DUF1778 family)